MKTHPYTGHLLEELTDLSYDVKTMQCNLDLWVEVERNFMNLDPLLGHPLDENRRQWFLKGNLATEQSNYLKVHSEMEILATLAVS